MNKDILKFYNINFRITSSLKFGKSAEVYQTIPSDLNYKICNFIEETGLKIIQDEILLDLQAAFQNRPFEFEEWGGDETFLQIGTSTCTFSQVNAIGTPSDIPTQDLIAIFQAWIDWVSSNKLENFVY